MALSELERQEIHELLEKLYFFQPKNEENSEYYDAKNQLKEMTRITEGNYSSIINNSVGLAGTVVDTLTQRVKLKNFNVPEEAHGVKRAIEANKLLDYAPIAHREAGINGINFAVIGQGDAAAGEPDTLVTFESANTLTFNTNPRTRKLSSALQVVYSKKGKIIAGTFMTPNETISLEAFEEGAGANRREYKFEEAENGRQEHGLGFVPVVPFGDRKRGHDLLSGRSIISPVVKGLVDKIQRTNFTLEILRDFYSLPQKIIIGANKDSFRGGVWKAYQDAMLAVGWTQKENEDGSTEWIKPEIQQFAGQSPEPLIAMLREYNRQLSVETSIPPTYFGINYANPASEGGARIGEASMIARCESMAHSFDTSWKLLLEYIAVFEGEATPEILSQISCHWGDPAILTKQDEASRAMMLVKKGVIQKNSEILYDLLGFDEAQRAKIKQENEQAEAQSLLATLRRMEADSQEAHELTNLGNNN